MEALIPLPESDALAGRAREGDRAALDALVLQFYRPVLAFVRRMVLHRDDAQDITQDVFARVVRGIREYRAGTRFSTWLFRIAINRVIDLSRKPRVRPPPPAPPPCDDPLTGRESVERFFDAVADLPESLKVPLLLAYQQNLPHSEIGEILEISANAVKLRIHEAVRRLRLALREERS